MPLLYSGAQAEFKCFYCMCLRKVYDVGIMLELQCKFVLLVAKYKY